MPPETLANNNMLGHWNSIPKAETEASLPLLAEQSISMQYLLPWSY